MRTILLSLILTFLTGCAATTSIVSSPPSEPPTASLFDTPASQTTLAASLFKDDTTIISNEDMAKILAAKPAIPADAKLIVIRFGQPPRWCGWSEDFVRATESMDIDFLSKLRSSKRLHNVSYLPSMVTPAQMTIPHLRQSAARCQADLMLIYRTSTRTYDKEKFIGRDETRAYCTAEAILVDTRTGLIPFSAIATETFSAKRSDRDMDFAETIARAEQQAIAKAWLKLADQTVAYFDASALR